MTNRTLAKRLETVADALPKVMRAQNRHRDILVFIFLGALVSILLRLGMRIYVRVAGGKEDAAGIMIGVVLEGIFLVSVISLLIVRRSEVGRVEVEDSVELQNSVTQAKQALEQYELAWNAVKGAAGVNIETVKHVVKLAAEDPPFLDTVNSDLRQAVNKYPRLSSKLNEIEAQVKIAENGERGLWISWDRIIVGYLFAVVSFIPAILLHPLDPPEAPYLALAMIGCACSASAYALLGRKKTTELRFLEDLKGAVRTMEVLSFPKAALFPEAADPKDKAAKDHHSDEPGEKSHPHS